MHVQQTSKLVKFYNGSLGRNCNVISVLMYTPCLQVFARVIVTEVTLSACVCTFITHVVIVTVITSTATLSVWTGKKHDWPTLLVHESIAAVIITGKLMT